MPVTIHLVRHAQGFHNLCRENEAIHDPRLTELGEQQCEKLRAQFPHHKQVTRLFASPLRRTLQTCLLAFGYRDTADTLQQPPVVAIPEFQEVADSPCDTGSEPATLKQEFESLVDLHCVYDGWNSTSEWVSWPVKAEAVRARATKARKVLREMLQYAGDDDHVVVVTHGAFLHFLTNDYHGVEPARATAWENTEFRSYHFSDPEGCDPEAWLRETEASWEQRHDNLARPTQKDQERLREIFLGQLGEFLTPAGSH
ncbi:phosphoglycerate mutase [Ilyonectria sp. MPI-CAGE-AT-0026]|nr:phosphoglycerate mutase [Ilyonectria sp. MPI-CAGE-AT-0026]